MTIERFFVPTLEQLAPLKSNTVDDDTLVKVQAVLQRWQDDRDFSYEDALQECDKLLDTCGIESVNPEGAPSYTDEGIRLCPPFSYCNAGDTYATTLARDHQAGAWVVACWGDLLEECERENELGDWEVFERCPESCPGCGKSSFQLEFFPGSARGPSYSWVCDSCNTHCYAQSAQDGVPIGEDEDGHEVMIHARKPNGMPWVFEVRIDGVDTPCPDYLPPFGSRHDFASPEQARERFIEVHKHRAELDAEDDDEQGEGDVEHTTD